MRQIVASNQSNTSLFLHLLVFLVLLSCFARLYCFEEKSNRFSLMKQVLTLFHMSHQVRRIRGGGGGGVSVETPGRPPLPDPPPD
jgi:hypothetical protein